MTASGHQDAFLPPRLSARYRFSQGTLAGTRGKGRDAPMDETALAVIGGKTRGLGSSEKQASCLEIEGPRTSPKTGAPMTDKAISPLRRRLIEDMTIRRLSPKTHYQYIRHVKKFADFLGRSADKATAKDVHRYQLWLASIGTSVGTANVSATALRFFFKITLKRHDLAEELVSTREPRRLPVVLSPEEVARLLAAATNIKHRAILSLAYATGLRASEAVSLKLTDIDRDRMLIRVEQGKGKKDRYVILSPILLEILHEWWRVARKKGWMSPGQPWL